jgi:transposase
VIAAIHQTTERWVRELPLLEADTWLLVHRVRVKCPNCGPRLEQLDWLDNRARFTRRFADSVIRLAAVLPLKQVAEYYRLHWETVKRLHQQHLQRTLEPADLREVEVIAMAEFAIQKGQRYATVVVEPYRKQVLWVGRGRGRADIRPFFEQLGAEGCTRLKALLMDMNGAYEEELRAQCPQAEAVFDLFPVVAKYGQDVIERVRVDAANRLKHDPAARQVVQGSRWLLLRTPANIKRADEQIRLDELLAANRKLAKVYILKEDLKSLWDYRHVGYAWRFWLQWYNRAMRHRIEPRQTFDGGAVRAIPHQQQPRRHGAH